METILQTHFVQKPVTVMLLVCPKFSRQFLLLETGTKTQHDRSTFAVCPETARPCNMTALKLNFKLFPKNRYYLRKDTITVKDLLILKRDTSSELQDEATNLSRQTSSSYQHSSGLRHLNTQSMTEGIN